MWRTFDTTGVHRLALRAYGEREWDRFDAVPIDRGGTHIVEKL